MMILGDATYQKVVHLATRKKLYQPVVLIGMPRRARELHKWCKTATEAKAYAERFIRRYRQLTGEKCAD